MDSLIDWLREVALFFLGLVLGVLGLAVFVAVGIPLIIAGSFMLLVAGHYVVEYVVGPLLGLTLGFLGWLLELFRG